MKVSKRKRLGQHFLRNPRLIKKIIDIVNPHKDELIIEIGAGKGSLTLPFSEKAKVVIAIEKDQSLVNYLNNIIPKNVILLKEDVLKSNFSEVLKKITFEHEKVKVVGSLPYSIASQIIIKLYESKELFPLWALVLQKEMGLRFTSHPGTKKYSPLTIMLQNFFIIKKELDIHPSSFQPPPKVHSTLITFRKRQTPVVDILDEKAFLNFLRNSFKSRRKTLMNNLLLSSLSRKVINEAFTKCHISPSARPENLNIETWHSLYSILLDSKKTK